MNKVFVYNEELVKLNEVKQLLEDFGILNYYNTGCDKSPPLRISYDLVEEKLPNIFKKEK